MIKRTITISSPSHLSLDRGQLVVYNKDRDQASTLPVSIGLVSLVQTSLAIERGCFPMSYSTMDMPSSVPSQPEQL